MSYINDDARKVLEADGVATAINGGELLAIHGTAQVEDSSFHGTRIIVYPLWLERGSLGCDPVLGDAINGMGENWTVRSFAREMDFDYLVLERFAS